MFVCSKGSGRLRESTTARMGRLESLGRLASALNCIELAASLAGTIRASSGYVTSNALHQAPQTLACWPSLHERLRPMLSHRSADSTHWPACRAMRDRRVTHGGVRCGLDNAAEYGAIAKLVAFAGGKYFIARNGWGFADFDAISPSAIGLCVGARRQSYGK